MLRGAAYTFGRLRCNESACVDPRSLYRGVPRSLVSARWKATIADNKMAPTQTLTAPIISTQEFAARRTKLGYAMQLNSWALYIGAEIKYMAGNIL